MALIHWQQPKLTVATETLRRRRHLDRISWREVLDAVGKVEMQLKRLHTSESLSTGNVLLGKVHLRFVCDLKTTVLEDVQSDPGIAPIAAAVADIIVGAKFVPSATPMVINLTCTFESEGGSGGWDPGGDDVDYGGRNDRAFGDPF